MTDSIRKHLYWRAGFGLSPGEFLEPDQRTIDQVWAQLLEEARQARPLPTPAPPDLQAFRADMQGFIKEQGRKVVQLGAAWIRRMGDPSESALLERMSLFWHGHFACHSRSERIAINQLNVIRANALGNFRDLLLGISQDPSMIRYLNNQQNRKQQPNENFAREVMELFTLGRGHYAEKDIKEAARAFTGWSSTMGGEFIFRKHWHDDGMKTVFGKTGNFDGTDIIDLLLEKRATAQFITTKVYQYFVHPEPNEEYVRELSDLFYESGYDIARLMTAIFTSDWFYSPKLQGTKIKSPVELIAGLTRQLNVEWTEDSSLFILQRALGQELFHPPNVAGWPKGQAWIDNSTLMLRLNLASILFQQAEADIPIRIGPEERQLTRQARKIQGTFSLKPLEKLAQAETLDSQLEQLRDFLLATTPSIPTSKLNEGLLNQSENHLARQCLRILSLPEYQIC